MASLGLTDVPMGTTDGVVVAVAECHGAATIATWTVATSML
jgi:hypothetical protein